MKKSIFLIGVLFVISIFVNCVYGYTTTDEGNIKFDSISEMYDYLENKGITFDKTINYDTYNTYRDELINSDLFKEYIEDYPYYIFSGSGSIYMFNKIPTFHFEYKDNGDGTFYIRTSIVSEGNFDMVQVYFTSGNKITSVVRDNLSSCADISPIIKFSTKFYNRENLSFSIKAENFDFLYTGTNENIIVKNPSFNFNPIYSDDECNIKLDVVNPPEKYTLEYMINIGNSWYIYNAENGITVNENCLIIVNMLDINRDVLYTDSYEVFGLDDTLSTNDFYISFDSTDSGDLGFTPILKNNLSDKYSIEFMLNSDSGVYFTDHAIDGVLWKDDEITDFGWTILKNSHTYYIYVGSSHTENFNFDLQFRIVNKSSQQVALSRSFRFNSSALKNASPVFSTTNGTKDTIFSSGTTDGIDNSVLSSDSLEIDWDVSNNLDVIKSFFTSTTGFFNLILSFLVLMPAWITVPLYTLFTLAIIIFVIKAFRG